jgi:hypothetical protein
MTGIRTTGRRAVLAAMGLAVPRLSRAAAPVCFGITPVFLDSGFGLLRDLKSHLKAALSAPVQLVKRRTYQGVVALLLTGQLDCAWICGFPYVRHADRLSRTINGNSSEQREAVRQTRSAPVVVDLHVYMEAQRAKLSRGHDFAQAMNYVLERCRSFTHFVTTAAFVYRTTRPSAGSGASRSGVARGSFAGLTAAATGRRRCIA